MNRKFVFIAVDIQNDFATKGGKVYTPKRCIAFLRNILFPYLAESGMRINEIISDYRPPRPGNRQDCCIPGTWGYQSLVPTELKQKNQWIKCMHSPIWTRKNIGNPKANPGLPYPAPEKFNDWLTKNIGKPETVEVIVFGLTIDCCVLAAVQELSWRGYSNFVLKDAVDAASGKLKDKNQILSAPLPNWATAINWTTLKKLLNK